MKSLALVAPRSVAPAAVAALVALCLVTFAPRAHAASLTQEQLSNVQQLLSSYGVDQSKIKAVSAVLSDQGVRNGVVASSTAPCQVPGRSLVRGMRSEDVTKLQQRLADEDYLQDDDVSGFFGPATEAALKQWQADQGLVSTGTPDTTGWGAVGSKTIQAMQRCKAPRPDNLKNDNASSTPRMEREREGKPFFPGGSGTPIPATAPQSSAGSVLQFAADYSDAFNQNMAAVATAPFNFYVPLVSSYFESWFK